MSEYLEMQEDGTLCNKCGAYVGEATGHPRSCVGCKSDHNQAKRNRKRQRKHEVKK